MPKARVTLGIGISNAYQEDIIDIDDTEWEECETDEEREDLLNVYWTHWSNEYIDGGIEVVE